LENWKPGSIKNHVDKEYQVHLVEDQVIVSMASNVVDPFSWHHLIESEHSEKSVNNSPNTECPTIWVYWKVPVGGNLSQALWHEILRRKVHCNCDEEPKHVQNLKS